MAETKREPWLSTEHWRQVLPTVLPSLFAVLGLLAIFWTDHGAVARNSEDIRRLIVLVGDVQKEMIEEDRRHEKAEFDLQRRIDLADSTLQVQSVAQAAINAQNKDLQDGVNKLTLALKGVTDLLPERRR